MLKLTRKVGEVVYIYPAENAETLTVAELFADKKIAIEVSDSKSGRIQLGFDAPNELTIIRAEVQNYQREQKSTSFWLDLLEELKHPFIFMGGTMLVLYLLLSITLTEFWGLFASLSALILLTAFFSTSFFKANKRFESFFFYVAMMPFIIGWFALMYKAFGVVTPDSEGLQVHLSYLDAIYFSTVTWTTLGYGDFRPADDITKIWVMIEVLLGYLYMGLFIGKLLLLGSKPTTK